MKNRRAISRLFYTLLTSALFVQPVLALDVGFYDRNDILYYNEDAICTTDTSTQNINLTGDGNLEIILNYLVDQGMTLQGAAGAAGNIQVESGFDPKNVQNDYENDPRHVRVNGAGDAKPAPLLSNGEIDRSKMFKPIDGIGFGLSQWTFGGTTDPRQGPLYQMAYDQKRDIVDIGLQLDYLWAELEGDYKTSTLDKIKDTTDVREAAKIYMINYEGPDDQSTAAQEGRADKAEAIYNRFKNRITGETANVSNIANVNNTQNAVPYKNPVINDYSAAPAVIQGEDGTYHAFTTGFRHYTSNNLVDWRLKQDRDSSWIKGGYPEWVNRDHWVPDIVKTGDTHTFVYTSGSPKRIGYGTSSSLTPPFEKSGDGVLLPPVNDYATIDPFLLDDGNGKYILYFGSNKYDRGILAVEYQLVNGKLQKTSQPRTAMKGDFDGASIFTNEAPYVIKRGSYYYMFYSAGTPSEGRYEVRVARSERPIGGYEKLKNSSGNPKAILSSGNGFVAPGQNSVITDGAGRDWIVYHAVSQASANRGQFDDRKMMIDPIEWVNGWPKIRDGHPSSGRQQDGPVPGASSTTPGTNEECDTNDSIDGIGSANGFTFPLQTTKSDLRRGIEGSVWCAGNDSNCHHDYNAADIFVETGTPILAAVAGRVVGSERDCSGSFGCSVSIRGNDGRLYYYTHMHQEAIVEDGARVSAGQKIGAVGTNATAADTPRHLHFDMLPPVDDGGPEHRPGCSSEECTEYPFINVQPFLNPAYEKLPQGDTLDV